MASEEDTNAIYDDDEEEEPLNDVVLDDDDADDSPDSDDSDDADTHSTSSPAVILPTSSSVSVAVLPPSSAPYNGSNRPRPPFPINYPLPGPFPSPSPSTSVVSLPAPNVVAATPVSERKPIDDSRRLFQRLWTDEDEIELLQGFLDYTCQRGPNWSGHHHDTTAFYDQIKSKLQLDCNKNQLVEKLRRLKKKYRTVVSRVSSGKDFVFKSPHDQATFEISRKIWSNSTANRPEFDEDDQNPNPSGASGGGGGGGGSPFISNLNNPPDHRTPTTFTVDVNSPNKLVMMMNTATPPNNTSRKRSRVKVEEKPSRNMNSGVYEPINLTPVGPPQVSVEETVKKCLSPLLKEFIENAAARNGTGFVGVDGGRGTSSLASNTIPMNFPAVNPGNGGQIMEERWRKQQIMELDIYSKRLELVQDQIKLTLEELRTRGN